MDWTLEPILGSYTMVICVAIALLALLVMIRESGRVTRKQSFVLWTLRLAMCLVVLLVMLKPGLTFTRQSTPRGTIAVMMDASASMQLPSGEAEGSRWDAQKSIWQSIWNERNAFGKDATLVPFVYDVNLKPLTGGDADTAAKLPDRPEGNSTDVGGPLNQLMSASLESPLSAVIWMGDGAQTHVPSGGDAQQLARRLAQIDVPLYVVGVGPRSDSENAQDLSVEEVPEQLDVYTKNPLNVRGLLRCRGVANRELLVKLLMIEPGKAPKEISVDRVKPTKPDQALPFRLSVLAPGEPGAYELAVRAEPVSGEAVVENNEATVYLNVRGGGARILYIEGEPRPEMNFIKRAMSESSDMQMVTVWVGKPPVEKWPYDLSQQLSDGVYDCIVLGDVDYRAIEAVGANTIADQVKKGAGLVTLGGYFAYGAGGWDQSPLRDILPVVMGGQKRQELNSPIQLQNHLPGPIQVLPVGANEILQIDTPEKNEATWGGLKPLQGANRWESVKRSPGTVVLAQSLLKQPLIVSGFADQGRVVSIAFDSTYLWWRQGKAAEHKAFWRKILYWCMRREVQEEGMQLSMPKRRLFLEQSSEMILQWNGGSKQTEMPKNIKLHLWKTADSVMVADINSLKKEEDLGEVQLQRRDAQSMRATFAGVKTGGRFEWRATVTGSEGQQLEAKLPFVVVDQSIETLQAMPDWQLLGQMAKLNSSAGGSLVAPDQTSEIVKQILERRKQSTQTAIENRRLGDGVLDSWSAFLLLAILMIGQWGLRKKWSLP
jgi:uncharacterized membrane protein